MDKVIGKVNAFLEGDDNAEYFFYQEEHDNPKPTDPQLCLSVNGQYNFIIVLPDLLFHSEDDALGSWVQEVNRYAEGQQDITSILKFATQKFGELGLHHDDEDDAGGNFDDDGVFMPVVEQPRVSNKEIEQDCEFQKFRQDYEVRGLVTNTQAASRIFSDLRQLWNVGKDFGFSAEPMKDNLFQWKVNFFGFEEDSLLYCDLQEYKRKTGREVLEFLMDFPQEYPFKPPFIRALRPRFVLYTGHITIGGSVCMELLTTSGWTAANSVESILIQIRTEIMEGGGRLDLKHAEYTEEEAKLAFHRVAQRHQWRTD
eukprot:GGOE01056358.1.p1 GENE.GGOE01056358.1~~GGOE01056358.1.p1  ORF type:complete len:313 (-),score=104.57 GGOE01056358.1:217-1155(-)